MKHFIVTVQENRGYKIGKITTGHDSILEAVEKALKKEIGNVPEIEVHVKEL